MRAHLARLARRAVAAATLLAAGSASAQPTRAVQTTRYTVRAGDTCAAIARRLLGDAHRWDLLHEHNPGMGPPPHRLVAGTVLRIPVLERERGGPDARVTAAQRRVEARGPAEEGWRAARPGLPLPRGWRVTTRERSSAELTFRDTSVLEMRERTLVIVFGPSARAAQRRSLEATLERGALRARLAELAGERPVALATPGATAELSGGDAVVSVDELGTSRIANHSSRAAYVVTRGRRRTRVRLPPGTGTRVSRGEAPTPPRLLLPAPRWTDAPVAVAGLAGRGATVRGAWEPVAGAAGYHVELLRGEGGSEMLGALELGAAARSFEAHGIPEGVARVRVSAVDREHLEGPPSEERALRVVGLRVRAPGAATAPAWLPGPDDLSAGAPIARVLLGSTLVAPEDVACALAGDSGAPAPARELALERAGRITIACVAADGGSVAPLELEVSPLRVALASRGGRLATEGLPRGESRVVRLAITGDVEVPPGLAAVGPPGVEVGPLARTSGGAWELRLGPTERAPAVVTLRFVVPPGATALATLDVPVAARVARRPAVVPPRPPPRPGRPEETFGQLPLRRSVGLRDEQRGSSTWTALAVLGPARAGATARLRGAAGVQLRLFDEPARVGVVVPVDLAGGDAPRRQAVVDPIVSGSWLLLTGPRVGLSLEVAAWLPLTEGGGFAAVRWLPSLDLSWRPAPAVVLRTRQVPLFDARSEGARLWASAWGAALGLAGGAVSLGAELTSTLGQDDGERVGVLAVDVGASAQHRFLAVSVGLRLALTGDAVRESGRLAAVLGLRAQP